MAKDEKVGMSYPSMEGKGFDSVELEREDLYPAKGTLYGKGIPEIDTMQIREIPQFFKERLQTAVEMGHLPSTFNHYLKVLEGAEVFDSRTLSNLKSFKKSVEEAGDYEDQKQVLKNIAKYLGSMKMQRR